MSTATVGGIDIEYDDRGTGDDVLVLVHGHPFDRSMWAPQVDAFSRQGWRVIVPDLRGYGRTTVVPGITTLDVFASDIAGLLDHLEVERFVAGGLSMGGQIVMEMYRLYGYRIRGLVLADTSPVAESAAGRVGRNALADRLLREGMKPYADEVLPMMVAPSNIEADPELAELVHAMMRSAPADGAAAALRGRAERPDYVPVLAGVEVPTLVVVGADDEFTPVREAELIRDTVPGATLVVVAGAAHMPNLERAAEFNHAMRTFLEGVR